MLETVLLITMEGSSLPKIKTMIDPGLKTVLSLTKEHGGIMLATILT